MSRSLFLSTTRGRFLERFWLGRSSAYFLAVAGEFVRELFADEEPPAYRWSFERVYLNNDNCASSSSSGTIVRSKRFLRSRIPYFTLSRSINWEMRFP